MRKIIHLLTICALASGSMAHGAGAVRDLNPSKWVTLDVGVTSLRNEILNNTEVYAKVLNNYTNPITCNIKLVLPTRGVGEGVTEAYLNDVVVFPSELNADAHSVQIDVPKLQRGESVVNNLALTMPGAAVCRGWKLGQRLPRVTCRYFAPEFEQGCVAARAAGMSYIPIVREHLHLGDCSCN
jgi:hypothetical protein